MTQTQKLASSTVNKTRKQLRDKGEEKGRRGEEGGVGERTEGVGQRRDREEKWREGMGKRNGEEPWLVWLSGLSSGLQTKKLLVQFPVRAHSWVAGQVPRGCVRGN